MQQQPMTFEAYTVDRFIEVVKAWVDRPWPISTDEGRRLFEDLGYAVDSEDPEMFLSEFASNGEADSYFTARDGIVGTVDINVTKYYDADDTTVDAKSVADRYAQYNVRVPVREGESRFVLRHGERPRQHG